MELQVGEERTVVKCRVLKGLSLREIYTDMVASLKEDVLSHLTVKERGAYLIFKTKDEQ